MPLQTGPEGGDRLDESCLFKGRARHWGLRRVFGVLRRPIAGDVRVGGDMALVGRRTPWGNRCGSRPGRAWSRAPAVGRTLRRSGVFVRVLPGEGGLVW